MAARRPARRRPSQRAHPPVDRARHRAREDSWFDHALDGSRPPGLRWSCAVIFLVGLALVALGGWGLLRGTARGPVAFGFGTSIVVGALLIVFAALLPWLADGPVRIGPLAVTLRIRSPAARTRRRRRRRRRV